MEIKANPDLTEPSQPKSLDNVQDSSPDTSTSSGGSMSSKSSADKIQQLLADIDLEDTDLLNMLLEQKRAKSEPASAVLKSVKDNAVEQVKQFGVSTAASLIAVLIAVITPIILNSQFAQDVKETIADIRKQLPNEADELLMSQVTELSKSNQNLINQISSKQLLLQAKNNELSKGNESFKQEYQQIEQKLVELETKSKSLADNSQLIEALSKQVEDLNKRVTRNSDGPNYALHKQLVKLTNEGTRLTQSQIEKSENWFRRVFYTVQGLQNPETNHQLKSHVAVLKSIADKKNGYSDFNKRKQEALIVLNALGSLATAAIIR
ncbi:MAG: hypothetical protein OQK04_10325 [Kangiellaceae bacterium]|nr:hypothetical protein [Kangiellaceae bacterium]MCW8999100.1 hypothetical protein [Kangiellaceae bacterium]